MSCRAIDIQYVRPLIPVTNIEVYCIFLVFKVIFERLNVNAMVCLVESFLGFCSAARKILIT